ncbi:clathrin heavy chain, putative [Entamoeba invadens IP1]|uniref:Clathrin heavy chain n=1 Tax=Entamoeba invadens IP1 TaxID=370355 RepID=A0A0A1UAM1_ENTIV|nr:clathrin heavy chain, putative [Entamoeba invadens IP1]ELP92102.1 clathrin heavy chain, putative [Entamoeba invadens IP1]|eukprot:XP_004258873.1 clathrin heavy chain, putative [Entamoeba invadens IP1]
MANRPPITIKEVVNLSRFVKPESISFNTVAIEGDKFFTVLEKGEEKRVRIFSTNKINSPDSRSCAADFAIMHPTRQIMAVASGTTVQMFDISSKSKVADITLQSPLVFWKWANEHILAIVTATAVFHFDLSTPTAPIKKVVDRHAELSAAQIIGYKIDPTEKWVAIIALLQRNNEIVGKIQLFSIEKNASQIIDGFAACFYNYKFDGAAQPSVMFAFAQKFPSPRLGLIEVVKGDPNKQNVNTVIDIPTQPQQAADFIVGLVVSIKFETIMMVSRMGFIYCFYAGDGTLLFQGKALDDTVYLTAYNQTLDGIFVAGKKGGITSISLEADKIVPFVCKALNNVGLGCKIAARCNLPGADEIFVERFNTLLAAGQIREAALIAANSPGELIRNSTTINKLSQMPAQPGQNPPLFLYFATILEGGSLNALEGFTLIQLLIPQNKLAAVESWIVNDKIECSEKSGDLVKPYDQRLALMIYSKAHATGKVVQSLAEMGQSDKIVAYCEKAGFQENYLEILNQILPSSGEAARAYANSLIQAKGYDGLDIIAVLDLFARYRYLKEITSLVLDTLNGDDEQYANVQTKILEMNLIAAPQIADTIFENDMLKHFDKQRIGKLCEQAGLFKRALQIFDQFDDIRRVLSHAAAIPPELIIEAFRKLAPEEAILVLQDLLRTNPRGNLQIIIKILLEFHQGIGDDKVIDLLQKFDCWEGLYYFLSQIVNNTEDPLVVFKYIEACARAGQFQELARIVQENSVYKPEDVKEFLKNSKIPDQIPFIIVCDRFNYVEEMTQYLYKNGSHRFIEAYVKKINPMNTPLVVGALLDCGCGEDYVQSLINAVGGICPADELIKACETRNRLVILLPWLEQRLSEGSPDVPLHTALAKVYVDQGKDAEKFLNNDMYYDALSVGKYCEDRDPYFAYICYKKKNLDDELIDVTNRHNLFKYQAKYLVERQDLGLWDKVLKPENEFRKNVVEQVIHTALPDCKDPNEILKTVQAFLNNDLPNDLIDLLDKLVTQNPEYANNPTLQKLLIQTSIKAAPNRVMDYIRKLKDYDAEEIGQSCIDDSLFEEAYEVYTKFDLKELAMDVLLRDIKDLTRAKDFADRSKMPLLYKKLGEAQLDEFKVKDAITSLLKAQDISLRQRVIDIAEQDGSYEDLVTYLNMCKEQTKDSIVETEILYCYAKLKKTEEIEKFLKNANCANLSAVADRCFNEEMYLAAKILYASLNNYIKMASCLIKLKDFAAAVEAAKKANSTRTWKEVTFACVDAKEFDLAKDTGLNILVAGDEISELVYYYEKNEYYDQIIDLLEAGLKLENAHISMFTELAILYSKYKEEKLYDYLKQYIEKIQCQKVIPTVNMNQQWKALVFLYVKEDQVKAIDTMILYPDACFDHLLMKDLLTKVPRIDMIYKAESYYLKEKSDKVCEMLIAVAHRCDHAQVISIARKEKDLDTIRDYLLYCLDLNNDAVNQACIDMFIDDKDPKSLKSLIEKNSNFNKTALANRLKAHEDPEFRKIAAYLYSSYDDYKSAMDLCMKEGFDSDAMQIAKKSKDEDKIGELLEYFVKEKKDESFGECLDVCYDYVPAEVALSLGYKNKLMDQTMPFMCKKMKETNDRIKKLEQLEKERNEAKKEPQVSEQGTPFGMLALPAAPGMMPMQQPQVGMMNQPMQGMMNQPMQMQQPQGAMGGMGMANQPMGQPAAPTSDFVF